MRRFRIIALYLVLFLFAFERCANNDIAPEINCDESTLAIVLQSKTDLTTCTASDGAIVVTATEGVEPYQFSINGGAFQSSTTFSNLGAGSYILTVKDENQCERTIDVTIEAAGSTLNATIQTTEDNQCSTDNGSTTVTATGGVAPYQYQIDAKGFGSSNTFASVKDAEGCSKTIGVTVARGNTGVSYASQIKGIITTNCALSGCHDAGSGSRNWTNFANLKSHASSIKTRVVNRTMPPTGSLSQQNIDLISCWVDDGALEN